MSTKLINSRCTILEGGNLDCGGITVEVDVDKKAPEWLYSTTYWLGSAVDDYHMWGVASDGYFFNGDYYNDGYLGIRPVIVISSSMAN